MLQGQNTPQTWTDLKYAVKKEFVAIDHVRRALDKLQKLVQATIVPKHLSDFRNIYITLPDIHKGEQLRNFCSGFKYEVGVEVLKEAADYFIEAAQIFMRIDSAIWRATYGDYPSSSSTVHPTSMEIGNVEGRSQMNSIHP